MRRIVVATLLCGCSSGDSARDAESADVNDVADIAEDVTHDRIVAEVDVIDVEADGPDVPARASFAISAPALGIGGIPFPLVVHAINDNGAIDASVSGILTIETEGDLQFASPDVLLRRGVGSITTEWSGAPGSISLGGAELARVGVSDAEPLTLEGALAGDQMWPAESVIRVTDDLVIDGDLEIEAGVWVVLADGANIDVIGVTDIRGDEARPVVFAPIDAAWGGLTFGAAAEVSHAFFVGGGADESREFGHSNSQPVLFAEGVDVSIADVVIQDSVGKAMGARRGSWTIARCLVTRTDTGGEFEYAAVAIEDSHYFDFPELDPIPRDDDNDAIYLLGEPADPDPPLITIRRSTFVSGADDGIDHNGSSVTIDGSWVEGFDNECVAASSGGTISVIDTALIGCAQGLEAGYGSPVVIGAHLLIMECAVGVRFGDSYDREYRGTLTLTDSVVANNTERAVWNWLLGPEAPAEGRVEVSRSLLDVDQSEGGAGNVIGIPILSDALLLEPSSPGVGIAADGLDPGLVTGRSR